MTSKKIITTLLSLFVSLPIWYFLLYTILSKLQVDRLVWFLYWIYIPVGILIHIIGSIADDN